MWNNKLFKKKFRGSWDLHNGKSCFVERMAVVYRMHPRMLQTVWVEKGKTASPVQFECLKSHSAPYLTSGHVCHYFYFSLVKSLIFEFFNIPRRTKPFRQPFRSRVEEMMQWFWSQEMSWGGSCGRVLSGSWFCRSPSRLEFASVLWGSLICKHTCLE